MTDVAPTPSPLKRQRCDEEVRGHDSAGRSAEPSPGPVGDGGPLRPPQAGDALHCV